MTGSQGTAKIVLRVAIELILKPRLWSTAWRVWFRMTPKRWWKKSPYLPVPSANFVKFRLLTMYGDGDKNQKNVVSDLVLWLEWCRQWSAVTS